ncbi:hypothetical protein HAZT_HAZT003547, partial [Hyalella azteca]
NNKRRKPLLPIVRGLVDQTHTNSHSSSADPDIAIIKRIVRHRERLLQQALIDKGAVGSNAIINKPRDIRSCTIHFRLPEGGFQAVTSNDGDRIYLSLDEDEDFLKAGQRLTLARCPENSSSHIKQLLQVPFSQLKEAAQAELHRQAERVVRSTELNQTTSELDAQEQEEDVDDESSLWTEVYKPTHYLHLLSDEMTNRSVLHWIKLWDKFVFGKEKKPRKPNEQAAVKRENWRENKFGKSQYRQPILLPNLNEELEADGRPVQKLLLLCGAPGLGKTTLAHIIARHAGYRPVELNASDDRSVDAFRSSIENATSMRSVLDVDKRPNCLIIDEIDGAPAPSIKLLVNLISGKGLGGNAPSKKGTKQKIFILQRPVIAICNDPFVTALRPLKPLALVVTFPPTLSTKLAQRLQEICNERGLSTDLTALLTLAHKTRNDIRSCLALLQFVKSKRGALKLSDIEGAAVGQKDYQQSLFSVWNNIFSIPRPANTATTSTTSTIVTLSDRYREVLQSAMSCSEYEKILQGWFENYPTCKFKHTHLEPVSDVLDYARVTIVVTAGLDWACFLDMLRTEIQKSQSWMLQGFLPHVFVSLHLNFASHQRPKITFPVQHTEQTAVQQRTETLITSLLNHMNPSSRVFAAAPLLLMDVLPYLSTILQPNFRPINTQLYSSKEKAELLSVIDTMIAYNLTYTQERSKEGQYSFVMEPNIEEVVRLNSNVNHRQLSYIARQLVAREVEMEKVRRSELYFSQQQQEKKLFSERNSIQTAIDKSVDKPSPLVKNPCDALPGDNSMVCSEESSARSDKKSLFQKNKSLCANIPSKSTPGDDVAKDDASEIISSQGSNDDESVPNHLRKLVAKPLLKLPETKMPRDFFGRVMQSSLSQQNKATNDIVKSTVWFRFKEGYSNAVRRSVKMKDLV